MSVTGDKLEAVFTQLKETADKSKSGVETLVETPHLTICKDSGILHIQTRVAGQQFTSYIAVSTIDRFYPIPCTRTDYNDRGALGCVRTVSVEVITTTGTHNIYVFCLSQELPRRPCFYKFRSAKTKREYIAARDAYYDSINSTSLYIAQAECVAMEIVRVLNSLIAK